MSLYVQQHPRTHIYSIYKLQVLNPCTHPLYSIYRSLSFSHHTHASFVILVPAMIRRVFIAQRSIAIALTLKDIIYTMRCVLYAVWCLAYFYNFNVTCIRKTRSLLFVYPSSSCVYCIYVCSYKLYVLCRYTKNV